VKCAKPQEWNSGAAIWVVCSAFSGIFASGSLAEIRRARVRNLGANNRLYSGLTEVYDELEEATAVQRRLGCPVIDISELSIEETAQRILRTVEGRKAEAAAAEGT